ncbi:MAG: hypothetical protein M2R45_01900 [Verrucomicrobia subdivision 3 bacterium]|nr:hypothetical protein [Limisphaerales bacterium]MCS1415698.1 hypothetical protein [Limisphaerales bacterium]
MVSSYRVIIGLYWLCDLRYEARDAVEVVYHRLRSAAGAPRERAAYATVHELQDHNLVTTGFSRVVVEELLQQEVTQGSQKVANTEVSASRGWQVYQTMGCMPCHSLDGATMQGVFGTQREFTKGLLGIADADYIRDSVLNPPKNVLKAFANSNIGMPSYQGILTESQVESLIAFIKIL